MIARFREGLANKPTNGQHFTKTEAYDIARFPEDGSFFACHGTTEHDHRLSYCKLFNNAGIIHMQRHSARKQSLTRGHAMVSLSSFADSQF
jgi:hypothetical protein